MLVLGSVQLRQARGVSHAPPDPMFGWPATASESPCTKRIYGLGKLPHHPDHMPDSIATLWSGTRRLVNGRPGSARPAGKPSMPSWRSRRSSSRSYRSCRAGGAGAREEARKEMSSRRAPRPAFSNAQAELQDDQIGITPEMGAAGPRTNAGRNLRGGDYYRNLSEGDDE